MFYKGGSLSQRKRCTRVKFQITGKWLVLALGYTTVHFSGRQTIHISAIQRPYPIQNNFNAL
ncbi:Uncharacterised protein [Candidatus Venteria ishoeyi]|uniref:Uncharacterized protein n=1 Tax=Candidatus Venteria ishoeyi TaxID=1899563 RepID=A0A1H6FH00_9GAMM|nr:Uncharacterised protein [Candidatus Venteria ishoeyi]